MYDGVFLTSFGLWNLILSFSESQHAKEENMKDAWKMKCYSLKHAVMIDEYIDVCLL